MSFSDQILTINFMRKYIHIARCMKPKLTEEACEVIASEYSKLRSEESLDSDIARVYNVYYLFRNTLLIILLTFHYLLIRHNL